MLLKFLAWNELEYRNRKISLEDGGGEEEGRRENG